MVKRYIILEPIGRDSIIVDPRTETEQETMDFILRYIQNNIKEFNVINTSENTIELGSGESHTGYMKNDAGEFFDIAYLINHLFIFDIRGNNDMSSYVGVFRPYPEKDMFKQVQEIKGANNARGYDVAESIEEEYDIDVNWDWKKFEKTLPVLTEI